MKLGLTDPNIFGPGPVQTDNENDEVRFLINCLLRDNRVEFEEELKYQSVNNIIIGIRMALRNCTSIIISYENYEDFVKHEIGILKIFFIFIFFFTVRHVMIPVY
jgi:hypothetical protein